MALSALRDSSSCRRQRDGRYRARHGDRLLLNRNLIELAALAVLFSFRLDRRLGSSAPVAGADTGLQRRSSTRIERPVAIGGERAGRADRINRLR
jgi:hypothetical protein